MRYAVRWLKLISMPLVLFVAGCSVQMKTNSPEDQAVVDSVTDTTPPALPTSLDWAEGTLTNTTNLNAE